MIVCRTKKEARQAMQSWKGDGATICAIPTMGALHEGHMSLIDLARTCSNKTAASIFVNPLQFAPTEDLETYPRLLERDLELLEKRGCDLAFTPDPNEMFANDFSTRIIVENITECFCGKSRPHFFEGVTTIVAKLLNVLSPDYAVFGEKDYQQLMTIKKLVRDLDLPVDIIGAPTVREANGLAMSSRNRYLTPEERKIAPELYLTLCAAGERLASGEAASETSLWATERLVEIGFTKIDYFNLADSMTLEPMATLDRPGRLLAAPWLGQTRLIDNIPVNP